MISVTARMYISAADSSWVPLPMKDSASCVQSMMSSVPAKAITMSSPRCRITPSKLLAIKSGPPLYNS